MKPFEFHRPKTVSQAVGLLSKHKEGAALLGGGSDLLGMLKDEVVGPSLRAPEHVIALKSIPELRSLRESDKGLRIGATVTVAELAALPAVAQKWPAVFQAAGQVAVPQIRNVATVAGNLCQRPRCWYFRGSLFRECYRKGGGHCYAPDGQNQYHAIFGGDSCHMVYPSDLAPALLASGAKVDVEGPKGRRTVSLEKFYVAPGDDILRENVLTRGELVVAVELPPPVRPTVGVYLKLKEREAFDFALVSVAVTAAVTGGVVSECRVVFGGLAPFPLRAKKVESSLRGKTLKEGAFAAAQATAEGAQPLSMNAYKADAAAGLLEKALGALA